MKAERKIEVQVLGAYGSKFRNMGMTSFFLDGKILIDAGNVIEPLGKKAFQINHIFVTHHHFDHICDIPFLIAEGFTHRNDTLFIYAIPEVIESLKEFVFNDEIWPDFSKIKLSSGKVALKFVPLPFGKEVEVEGFKVRPVPSDHIVASSGFLVEKDETVILFSTDSYSNSTALQSIAENPKLKAVFLSVSYPKSLQKLGKNSKHLTTSRLEQEIKNIPEKVRIFVYHMKPSFVNEIKKEVEEISQKLGRKIKVLSDGMKISIS